MGIMAFLAGKNLGMLALSVFLKKQKDWQDEKSVF
jgi:hypothetical protein